MADIDVGALRQTFADHGCEGIVALVDFLSSPEGYKAVTLGGWLNIEKIVGNDQPGAVLAGDFCIGSVSSKVTPLEWLQELSHTIAIVPPDVKDVFDTVCAEIARMANALPRGKVMFNTSEGTFAVPGDKFKRPMTAEELEPYRVSDDTLDE